MNTTTTMATMGLNKLKEVDQVLYDKLHSNGLFMDFFKGLFILERIQFKQPIELCVEKIAIFILNHFIDDNNPNDVCAICMCNVSKEDGIKSTACQHVFHKNCYNNWLQVNLSCPICRSHPFSNSNVSIYPN